jgi:hypothetical protein
MNLQYHAYDTSVLKDHAASASTTPASRESILNVPIGDGPMRAAVRNGRAELRRNHARARAPRFIDLGRLNRTSVRVSEGGLELPR